MHCYNAVCSMQLVKLPAVHACIERLTACSSRIYLSVEKSDSTVEVFAKTEEKVAQNACKFLYLPGTSAVMYMYTYVCYAAYYVLLRT